MICNFRRGFHIGCLQRSKVEKIQVLGNILALFLSAELRFEFGIFVT